MAKKGDIILKVYNDFPDYYTAYKSRLNELEREFLDIKNNRGISLNKLNANFSLNEEKLVAKFLEIESYHKERLEIIQKKYQKEFQELNCDINNHRLETDSLFQAEISTYQDILAQFEERKSEAFATYISLTKETNFQIDHEMKVHKNFIASETKALNDKKNEYQDLNSSLANQLLWTIEKAKNNLTKLSDSLSKTGNEDHEFLDETINKSLSYLNSSKVSMTNLFKNSTSLFQKEKHRIEAISKDKRKPHSEMNQSMILAFVKQIREVNKNKIDFENMIKKEFNLSLSRLYPKIIKADSENSDDLRKYIIQKEIIERKTNYLLKRNKSMSDLLISKYQNEIKKIKIDSFKRLTEIKLAYQAPVAFFQNSINIYSNFAFFVNETYDDLQKMLISFKTFNADYTKYKNDYIYNSQKSFEDYKLNLLVKVNEITNKLTEFIQGIDEVSNKIITIESENRLEIGEIRKKMENLEVYGDYQKYIASLDNDQFFAMHQHNANIEKIQFEANYKLDLLSIQKEALTLNQGKYEYLEYNDYMREISIHEYEIRKLSQKKIKESAKVLYKQKIDQLIILNKLAKHKIILNAKKNNYAYSKAYFEHINREANINQIGSNNIIDFVHHAQKLINLNQEQTNIIDKYIQYSSDQFAYLRILEKNRLKLLEQIDKSVDKTNAIYYQAVKVYKNEIETVRFECLELINDIKDLFKYQLLKDEHKLLQDNLNSDINGYLKKVILNIYQVYLKSSKLAYKYKADNQLVIIHKSTDVIFENLVNINLKTFNKLKHKRNESSKEITIQGYYIEGYEWIDYYEERLIDNINDIEKIALSKDLFLIEKTNQKAKSTKAIINKEYNRLEYKAIRTSKHKSRQLALLKSESDKITNLYKKQVSNLNEEYLKQLKTSNNISEEIKNEFNKLIYRNNTELNKMLSYLEKLTKNENKEIRKHYKLLEKSLKSIAFMDKTNHQKELEYIDDFYKNKNKNVSDSILELETKIKNLPNEKSSFYLYLKQEKNKLLKLKSKELNKKYAKIEKEKFVSRPKYLNSIEATKKRLPDDYIQLYLKIQKLEFDYLNQFSSINPEYINNYEEYIQKQSGNNKILETDSVLYSSFKKINQFYKEALVSSSQSYKTTLIKSKNTVEKLRKDEESIHKAQDRIINV